MITYILWLSFYFFLISTCGDDAWREWTHEFTFIFVFCLPLQFILSPLLSFSTGYYNQRIHISTKYFDKSSLALILWPLIRILTYIEYLYIDSINASFTLCISRFWASWLSGHRLLAGLAHNPNPPVSSFSLLDPLSFSSCSVLFPQFGFSFVYIPSPIYHRRSAVQAFVSSDPLAAVERSCPHLFPCLKSRSHALSFVLFFYIYIPHIHSHWCFLFVFHAKTFPQWTMMMMMILAVSWSGSCFHCR